MALRQQCLSETALIQQMQINQHELDSSPYSSTRMNLTSVFSEIQLNAELFQVSSFLGYVEIKLVVFIGGGGWLVGGGCLFLFPSLSICQCKYS